MQNPISDLNAGKHSALKYLYDRFFRTGVMVLSNYIYDKEVISDIVQDVFINIWSQREIFKDETHFKSYYYKSLKNRAFNYVSRLHGKAPLSIELTDTSDSAVDIILKEEVRRAISEALAELPEQRKSVVELYMEGKTQEEISMILGISVNTVKTHKRLAFTELRRELKRLLLLLFFYAP